MKCELKRYFNKVKKEREDMFKTPIDGVDEGLEILVYGEEDEDGYVYWEEKEVQGERDYKDIEEEYGRSVHQDVKDFLNSYWYIYLEGFYGEYLIMLDSVTPNHLHYKERILNYQQYAGMNLQKIPLGMEGNGRIIVVDNGSGEVQLEDYDDNSFEPISKSLEELLKGMRVVK